MLLRLFFALSLGCMTTLAVASAPKLELHRPWVRAMPPGSQMTAAYFTLVNKGSSAVTLVGATSPVAGSAGLHRSVEKNGHSSMHPVKQVKVAAGGSVTFKPGGLHVMLMGLKLVPAAGSRVKLCLKLTHGQLCQPFLVLRQAPRP